MDLLFGLLLVLFIECSAGQDVSTSLCVKGVIEGETLDCECLGLCSDNTVTPTWPGHSDTDHLVLTNITRQQDGEEFVCQMECGGQNYTTTYTLNVAYGPENDTEVVGHFPFITFNGTQMMTLTCHASGNPALDYGWLGVECENGKAHNTCRYVPNITDDGTLVDCVAINRIFNPPKRQRSRPFTLHLYYPPQVAPEITSAARHPILKAGDVLTCTVTGGKPLVSTVKFHCNNPDHHDQDDVRNETSVSSSLVIDTSQATEDNMTCYCAASWAARPDYYNVDGEKTFQLQYPAKVITFTLNGTHDSLTVTESKRSSVRIQCDARGRPEPRLLLSRTSHEGIVNLTDTSESGEDVTDASLDYNITITNWTVMGYYTCIVWNGVGVKDNTTVILNVNSKPQPASEDTAGRDRNTPLNMTDNGIHIDLRVYPEPDKFTFTYYKNDADQTGEDVSQKNMFTSHVINTGPGRNFMTCVITEKNDPAEYMGIYKVRISNDFGSVEYFFAVKEKNNTKVVLLSTDTIIIVVTVPVGSISAVTIIIVVVRRRRKGKRPSSDDRQTPQSPYYSNPTFAKNGADADNDSGVVMSASCHSPDSAGYAAVGDFPSSTQPDGVRRQASSGSAAYEVTDIAMGRVSIKEAAPPQPNVYQEPWDAVKAQSMVAECFIGHAVIIATGPEGDKHSI